MEKIFSIIPASSGTHSFMVIFLIIFLLVSIGGIFSIYSLRHTTVIITAAGLQVKGSIYGRSLKFEQLLLEQARIVNLLEEKGLAPVWRTNGIGLPGYLAGWFRLRDKEKALLFVSEKTRVVYLPTTLKYSLLLSLPQPEEFLDSLKQAAAQK